MSPFSKKIGASVPFVMWYEVQTIIIAFTFYKKFPNTNLNKLLKCRNFIWRRKHRFENNGLKKELLIPHVALTISDCVNKVLILPLMSNVEPYSLGKHNIAKHLQIFELANTSICYISIHLDFIKNMTKRIKND